MALPAIPFAWAGAATGAAYIKGLFSSSSDEDNKSSGISAGTVVLLGLAAVGTYTIGKGAVKVIKKGSG